MLSFKPAMNGLKTGFMTENNLKIHLVAAIAVILAGYFFKIMRNDWLWLVAAMGLVFTTEFLNTAVEKLTDLVSPDYNELAGRVKDIAAAAVVIICLTAALIGLIVFFPYLAQYSNLFKEPVQYMQNLRCLPALLHQLAVCYGLS